MKSFKEFVVEAKDLEAGDSVVVKKTVKLKSGTKLKDGEEFRVRTTDRENVHLHTSKQSFHLSWKEFEKYFDVVSK